MTYCMEAAAELGIQFIVLDRPNPLGNRIIAGGVIEPDCASFIGDYGLPMRYGMTPGRLEIILSHIEICRWIIW